MSSNRKPSQKYNPRALDESNLETLKMGVAEELWDISTSFLQTDEILGDAHEKIETLEIDRDNANARIEEVYRLSVEGDKILAEKITELSAELGEDISAQIKEEARVRAEKDLALAETITTLEAEVIKGDNLLSSQIVETNRVVSELDKTTAENKLELSSSISSVKDTAKNDLEAAEAALADAIARGDEAEAERLRAEIARLQGIIDANKADIEAKLKVTNTTVAELDKAMAENKLELEASIKSSSDNLEDLIDMTQDNLTKDYTAKVAAVSSDLAITNKALTTLEGTMAENKTELNSKIDGVSFDLAEAKQSIAGEIGSLESSLGVTNSTMTELTKTVAQNKTELSSAIQDVDAKVDGTEVKLKKVESDLTITNQTVSDLTSTVASNKLELSSSIKGVQEGASADATAKAEAAKAEAQKSLTEAQKALDKAIADGDEAEAAKLKAEIERLTGIINANKTDIEAKLSVTNTTVANLDKSLASQITNVQADYNGKIGAVNQELSATVNKLGQVESKWGVSVDANGSIGGVQLIGSGTAGTEFSVRADRFRLTDGANKYQPMYVENNVVTLSNLVIKGSCSFQGTINSSQILDEIVTMRNYSPSASPGRISTQVPAPMHINHAFVSGVLHTAQPNERIMLVNTPSDFTFGVERTGFNQNGYLRRYCVMGGQVIGEEYLFNGHLSNQGSGHILETIPGYWAINVPANLSGPFTLYLEAYGEKTYAVTVSYTPRLTTISLYKQSNQLG